MEKKNDLRLTTATQVTRLGKAPERYEGFVNTPVFRGSTIVFNTLDDIENSRLRYNYGTEGSPTISSLEEAWTSLSGAAGTVMAPSGLGAIALALLSVLRAGSHMLVPDSVYRSARQVCSDVLEQFGVETEYYDPLVGAGVESLLRPNTAVIFLESPGSQTFEIQDIPAITAVARKRGIKTVVDNTWSTPVFFKAHQHGCDLSIEAGTKYLGGHSDLLLGLVTANEETWPALRRTYAAMALMPGPEDCFLALRGLRTMYVRLKEAEKRGLEMARWLKERPEVSRVLHPALPDCPGHDLWKRDFTGSTGVFSVVLKPGYTKKGLAAMLDNMDIFSMGFSWGGYESLVTYFDCSTYRTATQWTAEGLCLRFQIGLEDPEDLKADLDRGFRRLSAPA